MKKYGFMFILLIFVLGWFASSTYSILTNDFQYFEFNGDNSGSDKASFPNLISKEQNSPKDRINESQIHVTNSKITIDLEDAQWSRFTNTNSMDPVIDDGANAIHIVPKSAEEIQVGDIIAYKSKFSSGTIIHRVVDINEDDKGIYFRARGDNIPYKDPEKIRFDQVERVLVAIIY